MANTGTRSLVLGTCLFVLGLLEPVVAGTASQPELTDRGGDANYVSDIQGLAPGQLPGTGSWQAGWADLDAVWVSTDYNLVPAVRNGVKGKQKVPYGFSVHFRVAETPRGVGNNIAYEMQWGWNNCTYSVVIQLPGALPDSNHAQLYENCAAGNNVYDLAGPKIEGRVVSAHVPFAIDRIFYYLFPGASLAEIRAYSGHYVDGGWPPAYRPVTKRYSVIDYAPSVGPLGYFELASDLEPLFIPDGGSQ